MKELRPSYYKNRRGRDIFWKMETRGYPYQWCLGFCQINADKYERRAGHKPGAEKSIDLQKAGVWADSDLNYLSQYFPKEAIDAMKEPAEDDE